MQNRRLPRLLAAALGICPLILSAALSFAQAPPAVPALPDQERRTSYSISASTCACSVNFALFGSGTDVDAWIEVWISGTRYLSTDPTFGWSLSSGTGPLATIPRPVTDAVLTFNTVQTGTVQIVGAERPRRTAQFAENRGVAARDLNQVITDLVAQNRETWDKINDVTGRGFFVPPGQTGGVITTPIVGSLLAVGTSAVAANTSSNSTYGLLFNKNGVLGDSSKDTSLSNGITGPTITISGNAAPLPNIASIISGGITPLFQIATANEGETLFALQSFGTNSNATIVGSKARGTAAAPLPILNGDIIFALSANGWATAGVNGGAAGTGAIYFAATENWSSAATGTAIRFITQVNGTAYPTSNGEYGRLNGDGGWIFGAIPFPFSGPLQSFGPGSVSVSKGFFVNPNAAILNSGLTGNTIHTSQADGVENIFLADSFGSSDSSIVLRRGNGTQATPTALAANDLIGGVFAQGMGATVFSTSRAAVSFFANQTWTDANQGTYLDLQTTANGSTSRTTRLRVENDGGITVPNSVSGGDQGAGTVNASGLFVGGTAVATVPTTAAPTTFTPSLSCGTATFTVNSAKSKAIATKLTWAEIDFTITAIGTCTAPATFTLPNTAASGGGLIGMEVVNSNAMVDCKVAAASATATCLRHGNVSFSVNDRFVASGTYENQ